MTTAYQCGECLWTGPEPIRHRQREYDGLDCGPYRVSEYLECPDCGHDQLDEVTLCPECQKLGMDIAIAAGLATCRAHQEENEDDRQL